MVLQLLWQLETYLDGTFFKFSALFVDIMTEMVEEYLFLSNYISIPAVRPDFQLSWRLQLLTSKTYLLLLGQV